MKELLCRTESAHEVEEFMKKSGDICRKCFGLFQRLVKLTKQQKELHNNLQQILQQKSTTATRKRGTTQEMLKSPKHCRREALNTPTKNFLHHSIVESSPIHSIAVRIT